MRAVFMDLEVRLRQLVGSGCTVHGPWRCSSVLNPPSPSYNARESNTLIMSLQDRLAGQDASQLLLAGSSIALVAATSPSGTRYNFPLIVSLTGVCSKPAAN